jgi:hypothetical protein
VEAPHDQKAERGHHPDDIEKQFHFPDLVPVTVFYNATNPKGDMLDGS